MQEHLKIRLTGAIILVVLVVSLVPEMFRGRPEGRTVHGDTGADELPLRSYTIDQNGNQLSGGATGSATSAAPITNLAMPAPVLSAPASVPSVTPAPTAAPATTPTPISAPSAATVPAAAAVPVAAPALAATPAVASSPSATAARTSGRWAVQIGTFSHRELADRMVKQVRARGFTVVAAGPDDRGLYRVRSAAFSTRASAEALRQKMVQKGLRPIINAAP